MIRIAILTFFCMAEIELVSDITFYFIFFWEFPRILHTLTNIKLLLMDQYRLENRSFLPMSHLYRLNFVEEECPREEDMRPVNYKD